MEAQLEEKPSESGASGSPLPSVKGPGHSFLVCLMWDTPNTYLLPAEDFPCSHLLNPTCEGVWRAIFGAGLLQNIMQSRGLTGTYYNHRPDYLYSIPLVRSRGWQDGSVGNGLAIQAWFELIFGSHVKMEGEN